jgi:Ca2+-binding RTX toxin-like protein
LARIRFYDALGEGGDLVGFDAAFIDGEGGDDIVVLGQRRIDRDSVALDMMDPTSDTMRYGTVVSGEARGGYILEDVYMWDRQDRPTLQFEDIGQFMPFGAGSTYVNFLRGSDTIVGNRYADRLLGSRGDDLLDGRGGDDRLEGGRDDDDLFGGRGADRLFGGSGDDVLFGGFGRDRLNGGAGEDSFVFRSARDAGRGSTRDVIGDFDRDDDFIDLAVIDANELRRGDQTFDFIGAAAFSGAAGEVRFRDGVLAADTDGDRRAEFQIAVEDVSRLTASDFIL